MTDRRTFALVLSCVLAAGAAGCGEEAEDGGASGTVRVDGTAAAAAFVRAAARHHRAGEPRVRVELRAAAAGSGFERLCRRGADVAAAGRAMDAGEAAACRRSGVDFVGLHVASDAIAVVTNPRLKVECLSTRQLRRLWRDGRVERYDELGARLPRRGVQLFAPGPGSDTVEQFTARVTGRAGRTGRDYRAAGEDARLARAIAGSEAGLGYGGLAAYAAGQDRLNLVAVDGGSGCVRPTSQTVQDGSYAPLSRRIFLYASATALERNEVSGFMRSVVDHQRVIALAARIVPTTNQQAARGRARLHRAMAPPASSAPVPATAR